MPACKQCGRAGGLTQQGLCQKAGLSYSTLAKIERGAIKSPSIFTIQSIAVALGTTLDDLLGTASLLPAARPRQRSRSGVSFVYFDVNGCLVRFFHRAFTKLSEVTAQPADVIETAFWHYNDQVCRGELSLNDFNAALAAQLHVASLDWQTYYLDAVDPIAESRELITWAAQHYGVGLLTNIMPGFIDALKQRDLIPNLTYDAIVDSSVIHAIKPEPQIYEVAAEQAHCPASEILLVDDSRTNLMAAEKLGWRVLWFDDYHPDESVARIRTALEPAEEPATITTPVSIPGPEPDQAAPSIQAFLTKQSQASDTIHEETYP